MSIRGKILLAFLCTIFMSTACVTAMVAWQMRQDARKDFEQASLGQLERMNNLLEATFKQNEEVAAYSSSLPELAAAFGKLPIFINTKEPIAYQREQLTPEGQTLDKEFERLRKAHPSFIAVGAGMEDGAYWEFPAAARKPGYDPRARAWYKQGMEAASTAVTPAFRSSSTNEVIYSVLAKVKRDNATIGIFTLDISLDTLARQVAAIRMGETGYFMLLEQTGTILVDPRHRDLEFKNISEGGIPALKGVAQRTNGSFIADIDGTPRLVTVLSGYQGWKMLSIIEMSEVYASTTSTIITMLLINTGIAVLLFLAAIWFARSICTPLKQMVRAARKIAEGDLNALPAESTLKGEMFELHESLHQMVSGLVDAIKVADKSHEIEEQSRRAQDALKQAELSREAAERSRTELIATAGRLESVAEVVSSASKELAEHIRESEKGADDQVIRVSEVAAAMEQMNTTVRKVTRSAETAVEASVSTRQKAESGARVVEQAVRSIRQVQDEALQLKTDMKTLGEQAQSINQIMGVISDIADQTNLLALNAAIEAARAGDAGRGFAVVADEVRKLAEKTMASTTDVANAIKAIQRSTETSMNQVDAAVASIEQATALANESGAALAEIVDMAEGTADQVRAIAHSSEEHSAASDGINTSIGHMNLIAEGTARSMETAADAVAGLSRQAGELATLIVKMRQ